VVVAQTTEGSGPASVVRVVDHPGTAASAEAFVARLGLSGFHGFDFVLVPGGQALMLEMNPRVTPICHLAAVGGHGLAAAMRAAMGREAPPSRCRQRGRPSCCSGTNSPAIPRASSLGVGTTFPGMICRCSDILWAIWRCDPRHAAPCGVAKAARSGFEETRGITGVSALVIAGNVLTGWIAWDR